MSQIARFYTLYWIIYFPTCIAYNDLAGFGYVDEVMTVVLMGYTFLTRHNWSTNKMPWKEYMVFLCILTFYIIYGLLFGRNVDNAVWLDLVQEIRPYSIIYCTWILNPRFSDRQKTLMIGAMILTLASWIYVHPQTTTDANAEFPVLGQMAICAGMGYYLFSEETQKNKLIALALVGTGLLAPKMKFMGEVVAFVAMLFYVKKQLDFKSPRTIWTIGLMMVFAIALTWTKFEVYYVDGWENEELARPMTYKTAWKILWDYFPLGPGMGTFACNAAWKYYSPLYYEYHLNNIWGLGGNQLKDGMFICDAFYPTLAQFGVVGVILFYIFWKRRLRAFNEIEDMKYYRVAMMAFFCLAIEQTADTSFLSGKGMGYCMLIALCLNANINQEEEEEEEDEEVEEEVERVKLADS
ncbi:MAG: hypothetical protein K6A78_09980 [Prevotella sp.]|nr:hypothetical protein [Prevotella sp.]